jgi:hypothetical protein
MTIAYVPGGVAGDTKLYPGGMCVPVADPHRHGGGDARGAIFNLSIENNSEDTRLLVFCPVVRDVSRGQEIGVKKVTIWVIDQHPDDETDLGPFFDPDNFHCTFNSRDNPKVSGDAVAIGETQSTGASPSVQELTFSNLPSASRGYYFIQCKIPAVFGNRVSGIIAYEVVENQ